MLPPHIRSVLDDEAAYAAQFERPELERALVDELKSRMPPAPHGIDTPHDQWLYSWHYEHEADYPCYTRRLSTQPAQIYLDASRLAKPHRYFDLGCVEHSNNHQWVAYTQDIDGNERYQICVRAMDDTEGAIITGADNAQAGVVWMNDHESLLYIALDDENRPREVRRWWFHQQREDIVYREPDTGWFIDLSETQDGRFA